MKFCRQTFKYLLILAIAPAMSAASWESLRALPIFGPVDCASNLGPALSARQKLAISLAWANMQDEISEPIGELLLERANRVSFEDLIQVATDLRNGNSEMSLQLIVRHRADFKERQRFLQLVMADENNGGDLLFQYEWLMDAVLGLDRRQIEALESKDQDDGRFEHLGLGASHAFWFSRYTVLFQTVQSALKLNARHVVDLGCGTGRLGLLIGFLAPQAVSTGIEIYRPRLRAAQESAKRWGFQERIQFREQDLLDRAVPIPKADFYYVYGPTNNVVQINLPIIKRLRTGEPFTLISTHTWTRNALKESDWLVYLPHLSKGIADAFKPRLTGESI